MKRISILLLLLLTATELLAESLGERFGAYDKNYALAQWTEGDEWAIEAQYSFKYKLFNCDLLNRPTVLGCREDAKTDIDVYFKYTGIFDFYAGSRESGPVINRLSNPGIHVRWVYKDPLREINWYDIGIEHRSNGQTTDANDVDDNPASPTFGRYIADIEYDKENHKYFDTISRGANYISLSMGGLLNDNIDYVLSAKIYDSSEESQITWGRLAGRKVNYKDYDIININLKKEFCTGNGFDHIDKITFGVDYRVGLKGLSSDSIDIYMIAPWATESKGWELPIFVKAHYGPMERLSDYTNSINSLGFGFALSY